MVLSVGSSASSFQLCQILDGKGWAERGVGEALGGKGLGGEGFGAKGFGGKGFGGKGLGGKELAARVNGCQLCDRELDSSPSLGTRNHKGEFCGETDIPRWSCMNGG